MIRSTFWSNTIWYILLGFFCIVQILFASKKAKNCKHLIALFLIISGMTFSFEVIVFFFFKAYNYYPMIFPQSPIDDGLAGNLFSQFTVTSTAILISSLNLKYYWFLIFSLIYGVVEEFFLSLGIYSHNWYQTWMTMLGLVLLFYISKKMYAVKFKQIDPLWKYLFMLFGLFTLHMHIIFWPSILSGIITLNTKLLSDAMISYTLISLTNLFLLSIAWMTIYFSNLTWLWKLTIVFALYGVIYFASSLNIIYVKDGYFIIFSTVDIFGMYLSVFILNKLMIDES